MVLVGIQDVILALDDASGMRAGRFASLLTLRPQLAVEPPHAQAEDRGEDGDDAAQHDESDEAEHDRHADSERADDDHEYVGNRIAGRQAAIYRRKFQFNALVAAYSADFIV